MTDLDERLDRAADDLWAVVPLGASARQVAPRRSVHVVVLGLAAVTLLVALGAVWVWRAAPATEPVSDLPGPSTPAPTSTIPGTTVPGSTPPTTVVEPTSSWPPAGTVLQTEVEYVIREGDYPTTVASLWQVPFDVLMTLNGWTLQDAGIVPEWPGVGATILIPAGATVPDLPTARSVDVAEQQMHVTLTSDLTCDQPFREPTDGVDSFVLELFSDREARRWLMRATFPDGSTYELIATGSVIYPETLHERGTWQGAAVGCGDGEILGAATGQGSMVALNIVPELTADEIPYFLGDVAVDAIQLTGERTTATGFVGTAFEQVVTGFAGDSGDSVGPAITQTTTWIVSDGTVVERTYENRIDGFGVATVTMSMIGYGDTSIPESAFDMAGATELTPLARPDGPPPAQLPGATAVPAVCGTYTVTEGDTPAMVATKLDVTLEALTAANTATPGFDAWFPGTVIQVPC